MHGCMVYTERAETAAISCGTNHASAVSTPLRWRLKQQEPHYKKLVIHVESHASTVSLFENGEQLCIKEININQFFCYVPMPFGKRMI